MSTPQYSRQPASSAAGDRRSTAPAAPKLRDSCHACASSKLKCHKEKPTCSRCAKRGLICEYVATKRGGRKHENRQTTNRGADSPRGNTATMNDTQFLTPISNWFDPNPTASSSDPLPSLSVVSSPRPSTSAASSSLFPSLLTPVDQSFSSAFGDPFADFDDLHGSPISASIQGLSDVDMLGQASFFPTGVDSCGNDSTNLFDSYPFSEDAVTGLFGIDNSHSHSSPNSHASPTSDAQSYQSSHVTEPACTCLGSALGLMKQLFPDFSTACNTSPIHGGFDKPYNLPTIEAVIAKNEHTIEAVSTMLQCSCSQDGYLLTIISLIVFKVLSWYAAAARRTPSSSDEENYSNNNNNINDNTKYNNNKSVPSPRTSLSRQSSHPEQVLQNPAVVGSYCLDGEDSARMAGQLVLSELHRVQCLVNQLSAKLKVQAGRAGGGGENKAKGSGFEDADSETVLPVSGVMLAQLEVDLRKRLRALSLEIAEGLRGE